MVSWIQQSIHNWGWFTWKSHDAGHGGIEIPRIKNSRWHFGIYGQSRQMTSTSWVTARVLWNWLHHFFETARIIQPKMVYRVLPKFGFSSVSFCQLNGDFPAVVDYQRVTTNWKPKNSPIIVSKLYHQYIPIMCILCAHYHFYINIYIILYYIYSII